MINNIIKKMLNKNILIVEVGFKLNKPLDYYDKLLKEHDLINDRNIITHDIKKLIIPDVTIDIGNISLGKYTFFIKSPFIVIQLAPFIIAVVNQVHGIIPHIKNIK